MPEEKVYELYLSLTFKIYVYGMLGLFIVVGTIVVATGISLFSEDNGTPLLFAIIIIILIGWIFYYICSFPHRITVSETGEVTFISLLRQRRTSIAEIESIKPDPSQFFGFLVIRTQNKKIKILNQFDNFHEFILNLKSKNHQSNCVVADEIVYAPNHSLQTDGANSSSRYSVVSSKGHTPTTDQPRR